MRLGITLAAVGMAGVVLLLAGAADFGSADIYAGNPWLLAAGGACFVVFLAGMYRVRKALRRIEANRYGRR